MSVNDISRIVIDDLTVILQFVTSIIDDSKGIIHNRNMFIEQATSVKVVKQLLLWTLLLKKLECLFLTSFFIFIRRLSPMEHMTVSHFFSPTLGQHETKNIVGNTHSSLFCHSNSGEKKFYNVDIKGTLL
jgi:hypothetical protein